ncbi:tRNA cyclic N6-threonylcarbamoyladenosine(37) synthase TcdA [Colwellia sp. E2M01]|uniref:tRNA cyclic N6-threonylcarbamoyladenosine(37) synthase TcdA n=1 Tax=Colwellia sp. E2M01 TaxID=2841561 RepID=UPI001C0A5DA4|nr:tRNA cyclic N6-threonylcarbamoyladenosine(37) synthase TcdA [Colwellia sp. E2M01]MBU2871520.1 tRNA cyclic N6-threonylcarbamoyladenosine(37) synthase TcdA [Colwellia sp. E2M01]
MSDYSLRFGGISRLYGVHGANTLKQSNFCVIGIGGVGSWVAEALARNGVGNITLIDLDDICTTNINRQIHALTETVGMSKVEVMSDRIKQINPDCQVNIIEDFVTVDNLAELLNSNTNQSFDYVIDAIDSVDIKTRIIAFCKRYKLPIITIGGAGGQVDPSKIAITDLSKTYQDPLLAKVKNQLRREFNFPRADVAKANKRKFSVDAVFSTEQLRYPADDNAGEVCLAKPDSNANGGGATRLDCHTGFGATTHVTATFAFFAVGRAIDKLLKKHQK